MDASPVQIIEYFDGKKQNLIPLFQRPYAWEKKDWQTLWDDIIVQYENDGRSRHFLGAIVSMPARAWPAGGVNKFLIIDGQQRLTTLAILLCAIRDSSEDNMGEMIQDYLVNRHNDGADKLKLMPTQLDRDTFRALVIDRTLPVNESKVKEAYDFFKNTIAGKDSDGNKIELKKLYGVIEQCLQVVMINLGESDDPYLIFESLNHKGKALSQADLVRNYVLMRFRHSMTSGGDQERVYERWWKPMENSLGEALEDFFRHYCIKDGEDVKKNNVYTSMKAKFTPLDSPEEVEKELEVVNRYASYYRLFIHPEEEKDPAVREHLDAIRNTGVTTCYPLFLRLYNSYRSNGISKDEFLRCLDLTESFIVRRMICNVQTNALNKLYLTWCRSYTESGTIEWLTTNQKRGIVTARWPTNSEVEQEIFNQPMYERATTQFILRMIESSYGHKELVLPDVLTIEHIMPQTLSPEWKEALGPEHLEVHKRLIDTLGNLTLTGYNSELGNLPFDKKKEKLTNTHIEMNRWVLSKEKWGSEEIAERGMELAKRIESLWPGPEA